MGRYTVQTDGFLADNLDATNLDDAIAEAFDGEGLGAIVDLASLEDKFARYVADGGWCRIKEDGVVIVSIGDR